MDTPEKVKLTQESQNSVRQLAELLHAAGLTYWEVMDMFLRETCELHLKAGAEYVAKGGQ